MVSQETDKRKKNSRITIRTYLRIALPSILIGGALGAIIGGSLDEVTNGIRVGIILGGVVAFVLIRRLSR